MPTPTANPKPRPETVFLILDSQQADALVAAIAQARHTGKSIILATSNKPAPEFADKMQHIAAVEDLPEPDLVIVNQIWTIGLPTEPKNLQAALEKWANPPEHETKEVI